VNSFGYVFPAIKGFQSGREYYVSMCPLRLIPRIFIFDEEELGPELRAQRILNKNRIPEMSRYITENRKSYIFSALTASIDAKVKFTSLGDDPASSLVGTLHIPMEAKFVINDGQHRRAAIEAALKDNPDLGDETIAVVFFLDIGMKRSQQMFADLNRHAVKPSKSLGILYDHRDINAQITKDVVMGLPFFRDLTEMERTSLSQRSKKLFTLSSIHAATTDLLHGMNDKTLSERTALAKSFWSIVYKQFKDWQLIRQSKLLSSEIRQNYLHSHGIILHALGRMGNSLLTQFPKQWEQVLSALPEIDWSRSNGDWEGRAIVGGRASKAEQNIILTTNYLKQKLNLQLTKEEKKIERAYERGTNGK
jgi:DNA sulfur modification protein DndB